MSLPKSSFSWFGIGCVTSILGIAGIGPLYKGAGNVIFGVLGVALLLASAYSWYMYGKLKGQEKRDSTPY
jgi:hypothetical protein